MVLAAFLGGVILSARLPVNDVIDRRTSDVSVRRARGAAVSGIALWSGCRVPYVVVEASGCPYGQSMCSNAADVPTAALIRRSITVASDELERLTTCKFYEDAADASAVLVTAEEDECYVNHIGKLTTGRNIMNIGKDWCSTDEGAVKHELLHVLGVEHEHQSPTSDPMLTRCAEGSCVPNTKNCRIYTSISQWTTTSYDPTSIMHYPVDEPSACSLAFTAAGETARANAGIASTAVGHVNNISSKDVAVVRTLYGLGPAPRQTSSPSSDSSSSGMSDGLLVGIALGAVALIGIIVIFGVSCTSSSSRVKYKQVPGAQF